MGINEKLDNDIKESLLGTPHVARAVQDYARVTGKTIDEVLDLIVANMRVNNLVKIRRKVEEALRHDPVKTYVTAALNGVIKDPVIR